MILITAFLVVLLALALFVAARELIGFHPDPEWEDVAQLRERFASPLPPLPHPRMAGRKDRVRFCLGVRREFRSAWTLCRFLAPVTGDAGYVGELFATKLRFDVALLVAVSSAAVGAGQINEQAMRHMSEIGQSMRQAALAVLGDSDIERSFAAG